MQEKRSQLLLQKTEPDRSSHAMSQSALPRIEAGISGSSGSHRAVWFRPTIPTAQQTQGNCQKAGPLAAEHPHSSHTMPLFGGRQEYANPISAYWRVLCSPATQRGCQRARLHELLALEGSAHVGELALLLEGAARVQQLMRALRLAADLGQQLLPPIQVPAPHRLHLQRNFFVSNECPSSPSRTKGVL